jgi:hypothetical protein
MCTPPSSHPSPPPPQTSQRDILLAFSFSLGGHNTPQPIIDEVWLALPTLRALLCFKDGWKHAKRETWERLLGAISGEHICFLENSLILACSLILTLRTRHPPLSHLAPHHLGSHLWYNHLPRRPLPNRVASLATRPRPWNGIHLSSQLLYRLGTTKRLAGSISTKDVCETRG